MVRLNSSLPNRVLLPCRYSKLGWVVVLFISSVLPLALPEAVQAQRAFEALKNRENDNGVIVVNSTAVEVRVEVFRTEVMYFAGSGADERCKAKLFLELESTPPSQALPSRNCVPFQADDLEPPDFQLFVDKRAVAIDSLIIENPWLIARDSLGLHNELSNSPRAIWSTDGYDFQFLKNHNDLYAMRYYRYNLAFTPGSNLTPGCYPIRVKVNRRRTFVRSRTEFCTGQTPMNSLARTEFGELMKSQLGSQLQGSIPISMQTGAFSIPGSDRQLVRVALEFPSDMLHSRMEPDGLLHGTIGVYGAILTVTGQGLIEFSDLYCCAGYSNPGFWGLPPSLYSDSGFGPLLTKARTSHHLPTRYETQIDLAPGEYKLQLVLSDGATYGRAESHLRIKPLPESGMSISSVMLSDRIRDAHAAEVERRKANFAPLYSPMVSKGVMVEPIGKLTFSTDDHLYAYVEIYDKKLAGPSAPTVRIETRILDGKAGNVLEELGNTDPSPYLDAANGTIRLGREIPIRALSRGSYILEIRALNSESQGTGWSSAEFTIN